MTELSEVKSRDLLDGDGRLRPEVLQQVTERAWVILKEELRIEAERRRMTQDKRLFRCGGR